jgi:iron complex outermembrane receptor protein
VTSHRRWISARLAGGYLWSALIFSGAALAHDHDFDIPAENAALSIPQFARQAGVQIVSPGGLSHTTTAAVQGYLETRKALERLLSSTDLYVAADDGAVIALRRAAAPPLGAGKDDIVKDTDDCTAPMRAAAASLALACGISSQALAQTPTPPPEDILQEVVVTAEKRSEDVSKVPIAITVFSGDRLVSEGVVTVDDLQNITPSMSVTRAPDGGVTLTLRGVTTTDFTPKGQPGVGFTIDGIPIQRPVETGNAFFDLERVEVLAGPQGTLYGVSTTGGAVNLITNKPKSDFEAGAVTELGNFNARRGTAYLNMPFTDDFAMRLAANFNQADGWLIPINGGPALNQEDNATGRLTALWRFADTSKLTITGTVGMQGGNGSGQDPYGNFVSYSGEQQRTIYDQQIPQLADDRFDNLNVEYDGVFGPVHATYDGAYLYYWAHDLSAADTNAAEIGGYNWLNERHIFRTDSHELRFSNANPGDWEWLAGANLLKEDIHESFHIWTAPLVDPTVADSVNSINPLNITTHRSVGVFGQLTYHVNDKLRLTLGLRDSDDSTDRTGTFAAGPGWPNAQGTPCIAPEDCIGSLNDGHQSASKLTYRAVADYQVTNNQMVYASVSTGYKAGAFNDFDPKTRQSAPYAPEEMTAYEIGYKGQPLSNLQFNSSAYYYDYSREQITSLVLFFQPPAPAPVAAVVYTQSVPTTIYGWENSLHWKATHADLIDASIVLMKSRYDRYTAGDLAFISSSGTASIGNVNWSGLSLDNTPAFVSTVGYTHDFFLPRGATLSLRLETKYSTSYIESDPAAASPQDPSNSDSRFTQPAYSRSNAWLTYATSDGRFRLQAFVTNLENKLQMTGAPGAVPAQTGLPPPGVAYGTPLSTAQLNAVSVNVSPPRMFGLRFALRY